MMKQISGKIIVFALIIFLSNSVFGQEAKPEMSKDEIIQKAWKAMFGDLKNEDIKSIYVEGYFHGSDVPNKTTSKRPNLFRNEVSSGVLVFDGERAAWAERYPDEEGNPREGEILEEYHWMHFEVDIALYFPAIFEFPSELRGIEAVNGSDTYVFFVRLPMGGRTIYWVDTTSYLITRRAVNYSMDEDADYWENLMMEYIDYDGILFPAGFTYEREGKIEKGIYKNVRLNINPDNEIFQIPEELR